jgi:hypothetical protein
MKCAWWLALAFVLVLSACQEKTGCDALKSQIRSLLDQANHCETADDCRAVFRGCPFGCYNLVNKDADLSRIEEMQEKYAGECPSCMYECDAKPEQSRIACGKNRCWVPE